jgi:DNA-directed RNA polymerase specialized sigma24 family protein
LHFYAGYNFKQIASIIGLNENAVKARMKRAREALEKLLIREEITGDDL